MGTILMIAFAAGMTVIFLLALAALLCEVRSFRRYDALLEAEDRALKRAEAWSFSDEEFDQLAADTYTHLRGRA
ncbi:MAG: hypothetical protein WCO96_01270 [Actinomycetes bacterium]|jgi:hypothetical protein